MYRIYTTVGLASLLAASCYSPKAAQCTLRCDQDKSCPAGASCGADGFCHTAESTGSCVTPDAAPGPDAVEPEPADASPCPVDDPCDDGSICTNNDTCNASGQCVGNPIGQLVYRYSDEGSAASPDEVRYRYSTSSTPPSGFALDREAFRLPPSAGGTLIPIYQKYSAPADDYMLTPDENESSGSPFNYALEPASPIGSIQETQLDGTVKLERWAQASPLRHISVVGDEQVPNGFDDEGGIQGYVCPP